MTTLKHLVLTLNLILCSAFLSIAQAQVPVALDVLIDSDQVRFAAGALEMRVEVFAPSGEMVFDSGAVTNQVIDWKMLNEKGERVANGVYLVTIQLKTATGQVRKRIEQVVVTSEPQGSAVSSAPSAATITGMGSNGRIAKFSGAATIDNSVIIQSAAGNIGIGTNVPSSPLHVRATGSDPAILGVNPMAPGIRGVSTVSVGVFGRSTEDAGVFGISGTGGSTSGIGVFGSSAASMGMGVFGVVTSNSSDTVGVRGTGNKGIGVHGFTNSTSNAGVYGQSLGTNGNGVLGEANSGANAIGVWGKSTSGEAGRFTGDVTVTGTLSKGGGSFKIDHPLDPANKYLSHSFVESPDMMNIYNGNVTTNANGEAVVSLPRYFQALNRDFRYQLTVVGQFAQAIVSEEMKGNHFQIRTDKPNVKVSWQVTGIRRDAWADAHRIPVEVEKPAKEQGFYLHPELFGQPEDKGIDWSLRPETMQQMKNREAHQSSSTQR